MTWVPIDFKVKRLNAVDKISDKSTKMSPPSPLVHCLKFLYVLRRDSVKCEHSRNFTDLVNSTSKTNSLPLKYIKFNYYSEPEVYSTKLMRYIYVKNLVGLKFWGSCKMIIKNCNNNCFCLFFCSPLYLSFNLFTFYINSVIFCWMQNIRCRHVPF